MNDRGHSSLPPQRLERACDPRTLGIVRGALRSTESEMEALIELTAMLPFIREKKVSMRRCSIAINYDSNL
jgi:hypothetical protein